MIKNIDDKKELIKDLIKESNLIGYLDVCNRKSCHRLILLAGDFSNYGIGCDNCEATWCDKHKNDVTTKCLECYWALCEKCELINKCSECGILDNHNCKWDKNCKHYLNKK